jgi:hypothetical protein
MVQNYCTLFDTYYLSRGLTMYKSLAAQTQDFFLYIFAFDDFTYEYLNFLNLPRVQVISLKEFEDPALKAVKASRSVGEYCWTCTPSTILYCLEKFNLPSCTYVDADLYFYSSPNSIFSEMPDKSILLTEHHYSSFVKTQQVAGKFCVQFMGFKNDSNGLKALTWWRERCIEWCYDRFEDGKFGDQKYLDDWEQRFAGVHVMQTRMGGMAPWNLDQYDVYQKNGEDRAVHRETGQDGAVIFFHFHALRISDDGHVSIGNYRYPKPALRILYVKYVKELLRTEDGMAPYFKEKGKVIPRPKAEPLTLRRRLGILRRRILGRNNIYLIQDFIK